MVSVKTSRKKIYVTGLLSVVLTGVLIWAVPAPAAAGPRKAPVRISPLSDSLRKTGKLPDPAARAAFRSFAEKTGSNAWRVRYSPKTALPEAIVGAKTLRYSGTPAEAAIAFLNENKVLLKVDVGQLRQAYSKKFMGVTHIQYGQFYNSVPVEFSYVRVHVGSSGEVTGYQSKFEPDINVSLSPALPAASAQNAVLSDLGFSARVTNSALVLFPDQDDGGTVKLAWKIRARAANLSSGVWVYYIDAQSGKILFRYNDLRYACPASPNASGTVSGSVYSISPLPSGSSTKPRESWIQPAANTPINNQYVWVTDNLTAPSRVVSGVTEAGTVAGDYCGSAAGKVFASLKGPYFSVVNFRGPSAHFDNGGGIWRTAATPAASPHPYANSQVYNYNLSIPDDWSGSGQAFAKAMPRFTSFTVGEMDPDPMYQEGTITDSDELHIKNGNTIVASYIGTRSQPFFGAAVENPSYSLTLETDEAGAFNGFSVDISSYLVLADSPQVKNDATGSIVWSTNTAGVFLDSSLGSVENALAEVNAFYHLNTAHDYFGLVNSTAPGGSPFADLSSKQVPVMVHAHGSADSIGTMGGMQNAFYDLEKDNIFLGDGPLVSGNYRSFALDGTIIRHEYTHRVVNQIYPIINFGEFGAISEAMADYFSLASFAHDGHAISMLGNFVGAGEGAARDLSGAAKSMPADWAGEVHDDSLILSQALWMLKNSTPTTSTDLGNFGASGAFANMPKADVFAYAALFYFPDNFANFYDAFLDACVQLDGGCPDGAKIRNAFMQHGISSDTVTGVDSYDAAARGVGLCGNNNGPECATDVSTMTSLSATIFPAGDVDYYAIPLQEGNFTAVLNLPSATAPDYYAYSLLLFDSERNIVLYPDGKEVIAAPIISNNYYDLCPDSGVCLTNSSRVALTYSVINPGRYYLVVSGALNQYSGNSPVASNTPYSLELSSPKGSAAQGSIIRIEAKYDQDVISFSLPCAKFPMLIAPSSASLTGNESVFEYAQLRDHNFQPLDDTKAYVVGLPGSFLSVSGTPLNEIIDSKTLITGKVSLNPGFSARYPAVGTVYLEVFGRNHMGGVISLGISNPINLTTNKSDIITYNNILVNPDDKAIVEYHLRSAGQLTVKIYTVTGSLVKTLISENVSAGKGNTIDWDGTNSSGSKVASGIYYIKAKGPGLDKTDKIAVVR